MAERAHPDLPGFKDNWFGLKKSKYKKALFERYAFCNGYVREKIVLDVPCGVGWETSLLRSYRKLYGIDKSAEAIDYAKKHFPGKNIEYAVGEIDNLLFGDDFFDVIICLEGYEHVPQDTGLRFLNEASRILRGGGLLIMTVPILTEGRHSGNPYHLFEPSREQIQDLLGERFKFQLFEIIHGPDSHLVRFVGSPRKS